MLVFPLHNDVSRKIIHIDMDAFFAAIEERDHPELRGKPLVIGADPRLTGGRGVVSTANYEARKYGIHSAMSSKEAYNLCPQAIFISGNYEKYRAVGQAVREIFKRYTDLVEPMSIDEAYLDVTTNKKGSRSAIKIAKMIQHDIWRELGLTCSAGVSYNKFLAKMASDHQKPKGLTVILPDEAQEFLKGMPVSAFHGVGKKTVERLHAMGIYKGEDLLGLSEMTLIDLFGRFGYDLYRKARGISNSPVKPERIRKSMGKEKTYAKILYDESDVLLELERLASRVASSLQGADLSGQVVVLKVRYADFKTLTKRRSLEKATQDKDTISQQAMAIYQTLEDNASGIRLLGITMTGLVPKSQQISLEL